MALHSKIDVAYPGNFTPMGFNPTFNHIRPDFRSAVSQKQVNGHGQVNKKSE